MSDTQPVKIIGVCRDLTAYEPRGYCIMVARREQGIRHNSLVLIRDSFRKDIHFPIIPEPD